MFFRRRPKIEDLINATSIRAFNHAEELHKSLQLRIARSVGELRSEMLEGFRMSKAQAKELLDAIVAIDGQLTKQADVISAEHGQLLVVLETMKNVNNELDSPDPDLADAITRANAIATRIGSSIDSIRGIVPDDLLPGTDTQAAQTTGSSSTTGATTAAIPDGTSSGSSSTSTSTSTDVNAGGNPPPETETKPEPDPNAGN